jgi:gamma-glutamyl:cysteine ligase YbdK (ATP-grasp superfamily)
MEPGVIGVIGLVFGGLIAWLVLRSRTAALNTHLSLMEKDLAAEKADLARLLQVQTELVASKARLESTLESERKTSNEKVELLTRASEELRNAFKALASEALKSNNSTFLVIAEETLKRFQSQARGDLEARQKAVADMVAPVRDSLNKVDAQIQQMEVRCSRSSPPRKSCNRRPAIWCGRCALPTCAGAGGRFSCGAWLRSPACSLIATSPNRSP